MDRVFTIRNAQMQVFEREARESFILRAMKHLRRQVPTKIAPTDEELRPSVEGWIEDARIWGFRTEPDILRYVTMVAEQFGQREPLGNRLQVFLRLHHEPLTTGVDLAQFAPSLITFARAHNILADEGVAWLATLVLAGRAKGNQDMRWIGAVLDGRPGDPVRPEEERMHEVHRQAITRSWVAPEGAA